MEQRIPVVDISRLGLSYNEEPTSAAFGAVGAQLVKAFEDIGFVYITSHGLKEEVVGASFGRAEEFFALPEEKKNTVSRLDNMGYIAVNREKLSSDSGRHELRESYDVNNLDGQFPDALVPQFRPSVCALLHALVTLANRLLKALEQGLGVASGTLIKGHSDMFRGASMNGSCLRMLHYPPVPPHAPPGTLRCGAHTDYGTITILIQDGMGGLEVRDRSGVWVEAPPLPGGLLVNVGDLLQMWTNDSLIATEHRVLVPAAEHKQRLPRRSFAFFVHPDNEVLVTALDGKKSRHEPVTALEHINNRFAETYQY